MTGAGSGAPIPATECRMGAPARTSADHDASRLRADDGRTVAIDVRRWMAVADSVDEDLLDRAVGPVLDVGCGPGRLIHALRRRGVDALGVEISPTAVALARSKGAAVLHRSIFDHLPGSGTWRTAILLDGSIGIGGDARALLSRVSELLAPGGRIIVETEGPGAVSESLTVRIETSNGFGPWFPWSVLAIDEVGDLARDNGLSVSEVWTDGGRWFAVLGDATPSGCARTHRY